MVTFCLVFFTPYFSHCHIYIILFIAISQDWNVWTISWRLGHLYPALPSSCPQTVRSSLPTPYIFRADWPGSTQNSASWNPCSSASKRASFLPFCVRNNRQLSDGAKKSAFSFYTEKKNYVNMIKAQGDKRACCPAFSWRGKWRTNQMKVSKKETQLTASDRLPYEKFLQKGAESLSDAELLAIMLRDRKSVV